VAVHAKRIEVAIALGKEERTYRVLIDERRHLEIEIGMLKDPARIIAIARDHLGMGPPAPTDIRAPARGAGGEAGKLFAFCALLAFALAIVYDGSGSMKDLVLDAKPGYRDRQLFLVSLRK